MQEDEGGVRSERGAKDWRGSEGRWMCGMGGREGWGEGKWVDAGTATRAKLASRGRRSTGEGRAMLGSTLSG